MAQVTQPDLFLSGRFNFVYEVNVTGPFVNPVFRIVDSVPNGDQAGVNPLNGGTDGPNADIDGVAVADNVNDGSISDPDLTDVVGDRVNDRFTVTDANNSAGVPTGEYRFVTAARTEDGSFDDVGFIAYNTTTQTYYFFTDTQYTGGGSAGARTLVIIDDADQAICFMAGTRIDAGDGRTVAVEDISIGDVLATHDGRRVSVVWVGRQTVSTLFADENRLPVRIRAGALGDNLPHHDLLVSSDHALFVEGVLVHAGALVNETTILRERDTPSVFVYYHVETEDHSLILAEGVAAETFVDNVDRGRFDNAAEFAALYPNGREVAELGLPRARSARQVPMAVRRLIEARVPAVLAPVSQVA